MTHIILTFKKEYLFRAANLLLMARGLTTAERFWARVEKGENCWVWKGHIGASGYGIFRMGGKDAPQMTAHRAAWTITYGPIPAGLLACHRCDNPTCVRPDHLFLGTPSDNMQDAIAKGRHLVGDRNPARRHPEIRQGERNSQARLTAELVKQIRLRYAGGETMAVLGREYGCTLQNISLIVNRKKWKHV